MINETHCFKQIELVLPNQMCVEFHAPIEQNYQEFIS